MCTVANGALYTMSIDVYNYGFKYIYIQEAVVKKKDTTTESTENTKI